MTAFLESLLVAAAFLGVLMFIVWAVAMRIQNAGIVDIAWALSFAPVAVLFAATSSGAVERRILLAAMVCLWSLRLGTYLWKRVMSHHPEEDGRYKRLREQFPKHSSLMFLGFFELQAVLVLILAAPWLLAFGNASPGIHVFEWLGVALWLIAVGGESLADAQLDAFRRDPANRGKVCASGLWKYSRHPNYFFEWMIWVAYFVFLCGSPWGWVSLYGPALMLFFLFRVTGIPATEEQAIRSRGDAYRGYQQRTSPFVPWFPKQS